MTLALVPPPTICGAVTVTGSTTWVCHAQPHDHPHHDYRRPA